MPSGHVRKRGDKSWAIIIDYGRDPLTGKRIKKHWETFKGKKTDADARLRRILADIEEGTAVDPSKEMVGEFLVRWLRDYGRPRLAPSTLESYEGKIRLYILPALGHVPLQKLQPLHLQSLYAALLDRGLSPRTVQYVHRIIHRALVMAVRWQLVARNVADAVEAPVPRRKEMPLPDAPDVQRLLAAFAGDTLGPLVAAAVYTGLRRGELLGLRWSDVDLEQQVIHVRRSMQRIIGQGRITREPKTEKARRVVDFPDSLVPILRRLRRNQAKDRLAMPEFWEDHGLVFCQANGRPLDPSGVSRRFHRMAVAAGFPGLRFHDLRHIYASLLLKLGIHPKVVQGLLGHSTVNITLDTYSHVLPGIKAEAAAKLDNLLAGGKQRRN